VSPLGRNRRLVSLVLRHLPVSDLSALSRLALLQEVRINWTLVEDVTPLSSQRHLVRLDLAHNRIADISPLANATQAEIWLAGNPLNEHSLSVVVPALRARGVMVHLQESRSTAATAADGSAASRSRSTRSGPDRRWA
jgi:hypothetical protein